MAVLLIWSTAGGIGFVAFCVGVAVRWCARSKNAFDVQLAEVERDGKLKELKLANEKLRLESERERRLLG